MQTSAGQRSAISRTDYEALQRFLLDASGIVLNDGKEYLVSSRLGGIMRENGLASIGDLLNQVKGGRNAALRTGLIDAMTTNETFWFRDQSHFRFVSEEILPNAKGPMRIWSAACSSGQEPYNISMVVEDYKRANRGTFSSSVEILGTDISRKMLEEARKGKYCGVSAGRGLTAEQQQRYFIPSGDCLEVKPEIKSRVSFRDINLTQSYSLLGRFDVIFCRNVLIYFSTNQKKDIIERLAQALKPNGYLFLGSTESLLAHAGRFEMVNTHGGIGYRLSS
jgi:chemotaxis protein methyltransferase CheR